MQLPIRATSTSAILTCAVVIGACSSGSHNDAPVVITKQSEASPLRLKLDVGDQLVYDFQQEEVMGFYTPPGSGEQTGTIKILIDATLIQKCVEATNGRFKFQDTFEDVEVEASADGRFKGTEENARRQRLEALVRTTPRFVDNRNRQLDSSGKLLGGISEVAAFPEGPISVGDSWEVQVPEVSAQDAAAQLKGMEPRIRFTFVSVDEVGQWKAARIRVEIQPNAVYALDKPAENWFDIDTGVLVRSEMAMRLLAPQPVFIQTRMSLREIRRQPPAGER